MLLSNIHINFVKYDPSVLFIDFTIKKIYNICKKQIIFYNKQTFDGRKKLKEKKTSRIDEPFGK